MFSPNIASSASTQAYVASSQAVNQRLASPYDGLPKQTAALADLAYDVVGSIVDRLGVRPPSPVARAVGASLDLTV